MQLFYCGKQWGYIPRISSPYLGTCLPPTNLRTTVRGQFITFMWDAPHPFVNYTLEYRIGSAGVYTSVIVGGTSMSVALLGNTNYQWRVRTNCTSSSSIYADSTFLTGSFIAGCVAVDINTINFIAIGNGQIEITWGDIGALSYTAKISCLKDFYAEVQTSIPKAIFNTNGLTACELIIIATCKDGSTHTTLPIVISLPSDTCNAPIKVNSISSVNSIFISWFSGNMGGDLFNIYLNDILVAENHNFTNFSFTGLTADTSYLITVIAVCKTGFSTPYILNLKTSSIVCAVAISSLIYNETARILSWTTSPAGFVAGTFSIVINNGTSISQAGNDLDYLVPLEIASAGFEATVKPICADGSEGINKSFVISSTICYAPTNLILLQKGKDLIVSWKSLLNAVSFKIQYNNGSGEVIVDNILTNSYTIPNTLAGSTYVVTVYCNCTLPNPIVSLGATTSIIIAKLLAIDFVVSNVHRISTNTIELTVERNPALVYFARNELKIKTIGNVIVYNGPITNDTVYTITSPALIGASVSLIINAFSVDPINQDPIPQGSTNFAFTIAQCGGAYTPYITFLNSKTISFGLGVVGANANQTKVFIKYALVGEEYNEGQEYLISALPALLPIQGLGRYKIMYAVNCGTEYMNFVEYKYLCPVLTSVQVFNFGTGIKAVIQPALIGDFTFTIIIKGLDRAELTYSSNTNEIIIPDLLPGFIYLGAAHLICNEFTPTISNVLEFIIQTQSSESNDCGEPVFTAIKQNSILVVQPNCVPVTIFSDFYPPNFTANVDYSYDIPLSGTPPFTIVRGISLRDFVILTVVDNYTLHVSGIPTNINYTDVNLSFSVINCNGDSVFVNKIVPVNP